MRKSTRKSTIGAAIESNAGGSFSTRFSLPSFVKRVEKLTVNQKDALSKVGVGNLLKMPNLTLNKIMLGELMQRWSCERLAFALLSKDIAINLMDVALILGIRVTGKPVLLKEDEPFSNLEQEYGAALWKRKITIASLESRLDSLGEAATEDFIRSFLLFTFGTFLFPDTTGKVDSRYLCVLKDLENASNYAWGAAVFDHILMWLCKRKKDNVQYVGGCLLFLQIWSYEHIDIARPILLDYKLKYPRACRWGSTVSRQKKWLASKFTELHENQIIWNLTLTSEESDQDIIKELLVAQNERSVHRTPEYSRITNLDLNVSDVSIRSIVVVTDIESESTVAVEGDLHQLDESQDAFELPMDGFRNSFMPCHELVEKELEHLTTSQDFCRNLSNDNDADLRTRNITLEEQIVELKKGSDARTRSLTVVTDSESESTVAVEGDLDLLGESQDVFELPINNFRNSFSPCHEQIEQELEHLSISHDCCISLFNDNDADLRTRNMTLEEQMMELRLENQLLRDKLSSSQSSCQLSEERNVVLEKEYGELKRENKYLKLSRHEHLLRCENIFLA